MKSVSSIEISPFSLLVMSKGVATREVGSMVKVQMAGLGEGARESVLRQNIQVDDEIDMSDTSEWVVVAAEEVLALLIGKIGNMLDLEVVDRE
jgi:hypothetical protein